MTSRSVRIATVSDARCVRWSSVVRARGRAFYATDRGVRPMGRAGAFVAGADDLGAVWYNPAGIADAGSALLVDFSWLDFTASYTRQLRIQNPDGTIQYPTSPTVKGNTPILPLPTIVGSYVFGSGAAVDVHAAGVLAPYVAPLTSFPGAVDRGSRRRRATRWARSTAPSWPCRGMWLAWKPIPELRHRLRRHGPRGDVQDGRDLRARAPPRTSPARRRTRSTTPPRN